MEKAVAPHSSTLAWKIPWTEEPGGLQSMWSLRVGDTTERLHFHFSLSCIGEGNGNPLQCSCLENPRDGGAWWAAVYGVTQSRTRLKWLSSISIYIYIYIYIYMHRKRRGDALSCCWWLYLGMCIGGRGYFIFCFCISFLQYHFNWNMLMYHIHHFKSQWKPKINRNSKGGFSDRSSDGAWADVLVQRTSFSSDPMEFLL